METMMPLMETPQSFHYPSASAPSSPRTSNSDYYYFTSAPASPSRGEFSFDLAAGFNGVPQFSSADELFEGGMVRPLISNPPQSSSSSSRFLRLENEEKETGNQDRTPHVRGRTVSSLSTNRSRSKIMARSLSPMRIDDTGFNQSAAPSSPVSKKWRLKDLFLFRSASEGRATSRGSKDPLNKYSFVKYDSNGSMRKARGNSATSPHEKHYMKNRAASEELKKRTPLPYHQSTLFGYLRLNPAINSISRRFGGCYANEGSSKY